METQNQESAAPILKVAWTKFGQLDAVSGKRSKAYESMRRWIAVFGVLSTLFAILTMLYPSNFPAVGGLVLRVLFVSSPILASALAAITNYIFSSGDWLITRAGAEEMLKEIYDYRTILKNTPTRRAWLEKKLGEIQRSVFRGMNGELVLEPYKGALPPPSRFNPKYPNSDPGFQRSNRGRIFQLQLENQLTWHIRKVNQKQKERIRLQLIIIVGAAGRLVCSIGGRINLMGCTGSLFHNHIHRLAGITQPGFGGSQLQQSQ